MDIQYNDKKYRIMTFKEAVEKVCELQKGECEKYTIIAIEQITNGIWTSLWFIEPDSMGGDGEMLFGNVLNEQIEE